MRVAPRLFALALGLALAACGRHQDDAQRLTFWGIGREGEAIAKLVPDFEREHPGVRVDVQQLPLTAAHQKLLTAFAGGSTPDLSQLGNTWIPELAALGALEPLQARVAHSQTIDPADYFPSIWDTNRVDGTLYGVPWYVDTRLLFYRKDILARLGYREAPRDWAQWQAMMARYSDPAQQRYGIVLPTNEFEQLLSLALQQDEPLLRDGGRYGNFESAGFKRALGFYVSIFRRGQAPVASNVQIGNPWSEFGRGAYLFYLSGPWNIGEFRQRLPADRQDEWATAPLPGPAGPGASNAGGSSLVIFRRSPQKALAWQLIEYLSRPEVQERFYALLGDMPPRRASWRMPLLREDDKAQAFREQLERVKPTPPIPEWERIVTEMQIVAAQAAHGELGVDAAAAEIDRRVDAILEKRRWMLERHATSLSDAIRPGEGRTSARRADRPEGGPARAGAASHPATATPLPASKALDRGLRRDEAAAWQRGGHP